jgi:hypothetical protein
MADTTDLRASAAQMRAQMPLLARHEGVWEGRYRYYDAEGKEVDSHASKLICRFRDDGPSTYHQTNHYTWDDGRTDVREFPAGLKDGRLFWDNDLIKGWASDVKLDEHARTTMLYWVRKGEPDTYLYEMIQISDCGQFRSRVWHWYKDGRLIQRTLIDETKSSDDWAAEDARMAAL